MGKLSMFTPAGSTDVSRAVAFAACAVASVVVINGAGAGRCVTQKMALAAAARPPIAANSGKKPAGRTGVLSSVCGRGVPVRELENCEVLVGGSEGEPKRELEMPEVERSGAAG